ncbi:DUF6527 family protein [Pseudoduganella sp. UC29_106]|uniref:DUF6527 family protein n=1 Tax=Pseudoduganella sp. UC29_106 TaxID=3374553 RepID=UPI0037569C61
MKAQPVKLIPAKGYEPCAIEECTHITLNIPGPSGRITFPVILKGTRDGTNCWTWNGSVDSPTLRPSVKTEGVDYFGTDFLCHTWINDGNAQYLDDCTHELKGQTVPLHDIEQRNENHVRP